ncbi:hypothetical protein P148_SR1C00001G0196 [candidate division SR1 bacterium RAAC1_SR1_1]|nr:hypothetical protein P148_SR1C00001G0196 [candidate division SR1 bacterium RAAC1_SR1_1]
MDIVQKDPFKPLRAKESYFMKKFADYPQITAKDIMIKPIFLYEDDDIETILGKLKAEDINYCIVVDKENKFLGEIKDEDIIKIIAHSSVNEPLVEILDIGYKRSINYTSTKDYLKKYDNIVQEDTRLFDIMKIIDKKGYHYIPVINIEKKVVGLITPSSILRFIVKR